ncbi:MAG: hypothetical protein ABW221_06830 [Vicinamibacteria bacterium]
MNRLVVSGALAAAVLGGAAPSARAQARALHWKAIDVQARLDADGVLHVRERQLLVMTGDWNGGERVFRLEASQELTLERVTREDPETGAVHELREGDLSNVDEYGWTDGRTLRWRSRAPSDPPFDGTSLVYVLEYALTGVLTQEGDRYRLAHDFAFGARPGPIESHVVDLEIDPVWTVEPSHRLHSETGRLPPGAGHVVRLDLGFAGAGAPAHVRSRALQDRLHLALLLVPALLYLHLLVSEWRRGRFARLDPEAVAHPDWLERNVLAHPAEIVGALWDRNVGPDEVAALVARLSAQGTLRTRAEGKELHLELLVDRDALAGYERTLVDAFFPDGGPTTSTSAIRTHYRRTGVGFSPAEEIRAGVTEQVDRLLGPPGRRFPYWMLPTGALVAAAAVLALAPVPPSQRLVAAFLLCFPLGILGSIGIGLGVVWRRRIDRGPLSTVFFLIPGTLLLFLAWAVVGASWEPLAFLSEGIEGSGAFAAPFRLASVLAVLGAVCAAVNAARTREGRRAVAFRKQIAAVRRYFARELDREEPSLRDEWFPYVLALGLDRQSRRWFERFGVVWSAGGTSPVRSSSGSSGSSSSASPIGWTGGGGAFGGAGATASWATAVGALSAGVSAPSSSSSGGGGGGGGGSSSGGGGGGGW